MQLHKAKIITSGTTAILINMRHSDGLWLDWNNFNNTYQSNELEFVTMERTPAQNKRLHQLLGKLGIDAEQKKELVLNHTNQRTQHSSEMDYNECNNLIAFLNANNMQEERNASDKMRKKIISHAYDLGWTTPAGSADIARIDNWCTKYGFKHKKLNFYTKAELSKLLTQFQKVVKSDYDKVQATKY